MLREMAMSSILGIPIIIFAGIFTFCVMLFTAYVGYNNFKGNQAIPFKWHPRLAIALIILTIIHAIFGIALFF